MNARAHPQPRLTVVTHPLIEDCLARLRNIETTTAEFRRAARLLTQLLLFEATRDLPLVGTSVVTPLEATTVNRIGRPIVLVPVLRSGLAMLDTATDMFPDARVGFVGLERDEHTALPRGYYRKLPTLIDQAAVMILEPMLATGGSAVASLEIAEADGARDVRLICAVAAPEGVRAVHERMADCAIYTATLDRGLNDRRYIMPGLGDFGDRYFGTVPP